VASVRQDQPDPGPAAPGWRVVFLKAAGMQFTLKEGKFTDVEMAFGTDRFQPEWKDIPESFKKPNIYLELAEALCLGLKMPNEEITFHEGFTDPDAGKDLNRCVHAHVHHMARSTNTKLPGSGS
jgi:hypothetical protein